MPGQPESDAPRRKSEPVEHGLPGQWLDVEKAAALAQAQVLAQCSTDDIRRTRTPRLHVYIRTSGMWSFVDRSSWSSAAFDEAHIHRDIGLHTWVRTRLPGAMSDLQTVVWRLRFRRRTGCFICEGNRAKTIRFSSCSAYRASCDHLGRRHLASGQVRSKSCRRQMVSLSSLLPIVPTSIRLRISGAGCEKILQPLHINPCVTSSMLAKRGSMPIPTRS